MNEFETEHFIVETGVYIHVIPFIQSSTAYYYGGERNTVKARRKTPSSTPFTLNVILGDNEVTLSAESVNGVAELDITSAVRMALGISINIVDGDDTEKVYFDTTTNVANTKKGINEETAQLLLRKSRAICDEEGLLSDGIDIPQSIIDGSKTLYFTHYNDVTELTLINATIDDKCMLNITSNAKYFVIGENDVFKRYIKLVPQSADKRYVRIDFDCGIAKPLGAGDNLPRLSIVFELLSEEVNVNSEELENIYGFERYLNGFTISAKVGIKNISAYDYAYYSTMLMLATNAIAELDGDSWNSYKCSIKTDKITINSGYSGNYNLEFEINLYKNEN